VCCKEVRDLAQLARPRTDRLGLAGACGGAQGPAFGGRHGIRASAQCDRQRRGDDLAGRMPVVLGRPAQQVEQCGIEHGLGVDQRQRMLEPRLWQLRTVADLHDHADRFAAPERHPNPLSRNKFSGIHLGWRAVVEQAAQRRVDGHAEDGFSHPGRPPQLSTNPVENSVDDLRECRPSAESAGEFFEMTTKSPLR